jgi:hypothetical protein
MYIKYIHWIQLYISIMTSTISSEQFDCWTFQDGYLFLGKDRHAQIASNSTVDRTVKRYVNDVSSSLMKIIENNFSGQVNEEENHYTSEFMTYRFAKEKEYREIYLAQMDYKIKTSQDNQYCAVYSETGIHCDFYQQLPSLENDWIKVTRGEYLFTLVRSTNHPSEWIINFIHHPNTQKPLILFGSCHQLKFYNLMGQVEHTVKGHTHLYYKYIEWINETSFLLHAWEWQPFAEVLLCDLKKFFADPEKYSPDLIWFDGDDWEKYPKVINGQIVMGTS